VPNLLTCLASRVDCCQCDDPVLMPRLAAFRKKAARMRTHRPVFPSVTRPNAAAMCTGCFPGKSGLHAQTILFRTVDASGPVDCDPDVMWQLRDVEGQALLTPTLGGMLGRHGLSHWGTGSWTDGCAIMHHPPDADAVGATGCALHVEFSNPPSANEKALARFGQWPSFGTPPYPSIEDFNAGTDNMAHALRLAREW